ncbi:hypothetical protein Htur_1464 [Haloterrigena turkmenica DSM 5511]|uniref:Uncharacterized protein n=1 Tax=Haloterrigena turkmenica (strain ATCC 51198 / DSM 5511 / JCM 9101 / NCIMB 13204 / VKM B-1734 / 4k) TaxID=543526 RepID=D2RQL9_HALTV|nr:DUF6775 family putative metallopeptidase [Haloterrigena turkmenica]ADB60350.1 hypothetical protein Htur_1464 [Haloterrigena turkmenica DSM 5511]
MVDTVVCYRAPSTVADVDAIGDWLEARIDASVSVRDRFLDVHRTDNLAERFAEARVPSPYDRKTGNTMLGTIRYEERALEHPEREGGVLYDGAQVQRALNSALPAAERDLETLHVAILDRAIGTWGDHDGRWHKRVNVLGQPALISVPGLYEAPAKPEEYYKEKQRHALLSGDAPPREVLENQVEGEFLIEDDPRTTDALKGYVLQAYHYLETGEAFCAQEGCRLYNAHYHEDLIEAQLREPAFCTAHARLYEQREA